MFFKHNLRSEYAAMKHVCRFNQQFIFFFLQILYSKATVFFLKIVIRLIINLMIETLKVQGLLLQQQTFLPQNQSLYRRLLSLKI